MANERVEKTLILLDEAEVRQVLLLARENDPARIFDFITQIIAKKVEAALRRRCK